MKYNIGDKIYRVIFDRVESKEVPCETCDKTGEITIKDNKFPCPICHQHLSNKGSGTVIVKRKIYKLEESIINKYILIKDKWTERITWFVSTPKEAIVKRIRSEDSVDHIWFKNRAEAVEKLNELNDVEFS